MTEKRPQWARDLARAIFNAETQENGGMMQGGFGFLHPMTIAAYERLAVETVAKARELNSPPDPPAPSRESAPRAGRTSDGARE